MGLLRRTATLPVTSYGYAPPPGATARGWRCPAPDCGFGDDTAPRRWPFACTECGHPADPDFDEPWAHDAREPWLRHELDVAAPAQRGFWLGELIAWRHRDAVRRRDLEAAEAARGQARRWLADTAADPYRIAGQVHHPIVVGALGADWIDSAVDELTFWCRRVRTEDVEHDNARRTDCRQLLSALLAYLEHPATPRHPRTPELRRSAVALRDTIRDVLSVDLERRSRHLHEDGFVPATEPAEPPLDPVDQLEAFGRFSFDPMAADYDAGLMWARVAAPRFASAQADPDRFCRELAAVALPRGGWFVYGAQRLVVELLGGDYRGTEFLRMQDAALEWLRRGGVSAAHLTGYEQRRWYETHGSIGWEG
jgi:hypothetical protein